jgi:hypothetical protein
MKEKIIEMLKTDLLRLYCHNCGNYDSNYCVHCWRKAGHMAWRPSDEMLSDLADKIIALIKGD